MATYPTIPYATPIPMRNATGRATLPKRKSTRSTSGFNPSVATLQQNLNTKYAGTSGYVPLAVDGIYGPKTKSAQSFTPAVVDTSGVTGTSAADIAKGTGFNFSQSPEDERYNKLQDDIYNYQSSQFNQVLDPNEVYQKALSRYQGQIDAINNVYNDKINQARVQGQGRIESRQFSQGRSGQIGSGTGEAGINAVQDANTEIENSINAERAAAISAIYSQVRNNADEDLKAKTLAKQQGADALLSYLADVPKKRKERLSSAVKSLLLNGVDVTNMTPEEIASYVNGLGVSENDFKSEFTSQVSELEKEKAKEAQDKLKSYPAMVQEYEYAKANGYKGSFTQYQNEDANRKQRAVTPSDKPTKTYTINAGDTLFNIANSLGLNPDALVAVNPSVNVLNLRPGQKINLPTSSDGTPTAVDLKQTINQAIAASGQAFQDATEEEQKTYIRSLGGNPSDFGY